MNDPDNAGGTDAWMTAEPQAGTAARGASASHHSGHSGGSLAPGLGRSEQGSRDRPVRPGRLTRGSRARAGGRAKSCRFDAERPQAWVAPDRGGAPEHVPPRRGDGPHADVENTASRHEEKVAERIAEVEALIGEAATADGAHEKRGKS